MNAPIRVVVAEDHAVVRQMLCSTLAAEPDLEVVGSAATGPEAVQAVARLGPDVLLLDLKMPGLDGLAVTRQVCARHPGVRILILTAVEEEAPLFEALQAGARGYLLKDSSLEEITQALRRVHEGQAVLHPRSTLSLLNEFQRFRNAPSGGDPEEQALLARLSPRELEVLRLVARGLSNREIGDVLIISEKTAKTHVSNLLRRMNARDRIQAALVAIRNGLLPVD